MLYRRLLALTVLLADTANAGEPKQHLQPATESCSEIEMHAGDDANEDPGKADWCFDLVLRVVASTVRAESWYRTTLGRWEMHGMDKLQVCAEPVIEFVRTRCGRAGTMSAPLLGFLIETDDSAGTMMLRFYGAVWFVDWLRSGAPD